MRDAETGEEEAKEEEEEQFLEKVERGEAECKWELESLR